MKHFPGIKDQHNIQLELSEDVPSSTENHQKKVYSLESWLQFCVHSLAQKVKSEICSQNRSSFCGSSKINRLDEWNWLLRQSIPSDATDSCLRFQSSFSTKCWRRVCPIFRVERKRNFIWWPGTENNNNFRVECEFHLFSTIKIESKLSILIAPFKHKLY